jgi:flagellar operon protein (TIGR03826 family)
MSLNVGNCPKCGRIFDKKFRDVCPKCHQEVEDQYGKCIQYLRENRKCTLEELSKAVEVPMHLIAKFIREGRISLAQTPNMFYPCEMCGEGIRLGNICDTCRRKLIKDVNHMNHMEKQNDVKKHSNHGYKVNE